MEWALFARKKNSQISKSFGNGKGLSFNSVTMMEYASS